MGIKARTKKDLAENIKHEFKAGNKTSCGFSL